MTWWSSGDVEPKRNYRFLVVFGTPSITTAPSEHDGNAFWAKTCDAPSFDVTEVEHNFYDNKYYYPGRVTWNEINMTLVDPKSLNLAHGFNAVMANSDYVVKASASSLKSISKTKAGGALGTVTIRVFDAEGTCIEQWSLQNSFVKSLKFGSFDYSNDELRQLDMTIRYDWCKISTDDSNTNELHTPV